MSIFIGEDEIIKMFKGTERIHKIGYGKSDLINIGSENELDDVQYNKGFYPPIGMSCAYEDMDIIISTYNINGINENNIKYYTAYIYEACSNKLIDTIKGYDEQLEVSDGQIRNVGDQMISIEKDDLIIKHHNKMEYNKTYYIKLDTYDDSLYTSNKDLISYMEDNTENIDIDYDEMDLTEFLESGQWKFTIRDKPSITPYNDLNFIYVNNNYKYYLKHFQNTCDVGYVFGNSYDASWEDIYPDFLSINGAFKYLKNKTGKYYIFIDSSIGNIYSFNELLYLDTDANVFLYSKLDDDERCIKVQFDNCGVLNLEEVERSLFEYKGSGTLLMKNIIFNNTYSRAKYRKIVKNSSGKYYEYNSSGECFGISGTGNVAAYNCKFSSKQDTLRLKNTSYFLNCNIQGDVDFIWAEIGFESSLIKDCNIYVVNDDERIRVNSTTGEISKDTSKVCVMTCPKQSISPFIGRGLVIDNCEIYSNQANDIRFYYGRNPWQESYYNNVTVSNCTIDLPSTITSTILINGTNISSYLWYNSGNGLDENIGFKDYNNYYLDKNNNKCLISSDTINMTKNQDIRYFDYSSTTFKNYVIFSKEDSLTWINYLQAHRRDIKITFKTINTEKPVLVKIFYPKDSSKNGSLSKSFVLYNGYIYTNNSVNSYYTTYNYVTDYCYLNAKTTQTFDLSTIEGRKENTEYQYSRHFTYTFEVIDFYNGSSSYTYSNKLYYGNKSSTDLSYSYYVSDTIISNDDVSHSSSTGIVSYNSSLIGTTNVSKETVTVNSHNYIKYTTTTYDEIDYRTSDTYSISQSEYESTTNMCALNTIYNSLNNKLQKSFKEFDMEEMEESLYKKMYSADSYNSKYYEIINASNQNIKIWNMSSLYMDTIEGIYETKSLAANNKDSESFNNFIYFYNNESQTAKVAFNGNSLMFLNKDTKVWIPFTDSNNYIIINCYPGYHNYLTNGVIVNNDSMTFSKENIITIENPSFLPSGKYMLINALDVVYISHIYVC